MFPNLQELLEKHRLGEDSYLELNALHFKGEQVSGPSRRALADELAAFANSRGGVFVLGVDDSTREITGIPIERLNAVEDFVRELAVDSVDPPVPIVTERLSVPAGSGQRVAVLRVDVPKSLFVHKSPGGYLHRVGSSKREMSPEYLAHLFQQRSQTRIIRFDEQAVPGATPDDLDTTLWERFRTTRSLDEARLVSGEAGAGARRRRRSGATHGGGRAARVARATALSAQRVHPGRRIPRQHGGSRK